MDGDSASTVPPLRAGDLVDNRFCVERVLGRGNYALVYAATNVVTGKSVALKWPRRSGMVAALLREARAAARVRHSSVIDIYDVGEHGGTMFLIMEQLRAATLGYQLARRALGLSGFFAVIDAVIECLHAIHQSGLAHCDLKPSNILVWSDEGGGAIRTKLIDFGSVKLLGASGALHRGLSHPGTPPYAPPEQLANSSSLDHRADIYALGIILRRALRATTCVDSTWRSFQEAVKRATHAEPSLRFRNVLEFRDALSLGRAAI